MFKYKINKPIKNTEQMDISNNTAINILINAIKNNASIEEITILLDTGINSNTPTVQTYWADNIGTNYALIEAVKVDRFDIVQLLIERSADINVQQSWDGTTPLSASFSTTSYPKITKFLIENGADLTKETAWAGTPLLRAVYRNDINMVDFLLKAGANPNHDSSAVVDENDFESVPLHEAIRQKNKKIITLLVKHGARFDFCGVLDSALEIAAQCGSIKIMRLLISLGADVNTRGEYNTALHVAVSQENVTLARFLLLQGADATLLAYNNLTAFGQLIQQRHYDHILKRITCETMLNLFFKHAPVTSLLAEDSLYKAIEYGDIEVVTRLLNAGADINAINKNGHSPLHCAVARQHVNIIRLLLEKRACQNVYDSYNKSPLDWALQSQNQEIITLLEEDNKATYHTIGKN
jgi:ankyrin repeat protein